MLSAAERNLFNAIEHSVSKKANSLAISILQDIWQWLVLFPSILVKKLMEGSHDNISQHAEDLKADDARFHCQSHSLNALFMSLQRVNSFISGSNMHIISSMDANDFISKVLKRCF